jgi:hypothetical protein
MLDRRKRIKELLQTFLFLLFFIVTVSLNLTCSAEDNPASSEECGSGRVMWNDKAQVCIDQANNKVVPSNCCGR